MIHWLTAKRTAIVLSPNIFFGGLSGNRTHDMAVAEPCLSHLAINPIYFLAGRAGLEPTLDRFKVCCLTNLAIPQYISTPIAES